VGLAGKEEVILLGAGLIALALEVFVFPGFGIAGIISIACIAAAIFLALIGSMPTWADFARASAIVAVTLGLIIAAIYTIVRQLPTSDRWRHIFLKTAAARDEGFVSAPIRSELVGQEGVALTDLHPSGTARFGGERLDVVSEGGYVARGQRVRAIRAEGYRLVVLPVDA
jgi:membrane-bound serine protease (ClpP class)